MLSASYISLLQFFLRFICVKLQLKSCGQFLNFKGIYFPSNSIKFKPLFWVTEKSCGHLVLKFFHQFLLLRHQTLGKHYEKLMARILFYKYQILRYILIKYSIYTEVLGGKKQFCLELSKLPNTTKVLYLNLYHLVVSELNKRTYIYVGIFTIENWFTPIKSVNISYQWNFGVGQGFCQQPFSRLSNAKFL